MVSADFSGQECDAASTPSVSRPLAQPDTEIQAAKSSVNDKLEWNYFIYKLLFSYFLLILMFKNLILDSGFNANMYKNESESYQ